MIVCSLLSVSCVFTPDCFWSSAPFMSPDQWYQDNTKLFVVLVPDHHQRLWDIRDDFASEWPWTARFPCQLWGHCGRCGALRLCLEGRAKTGQPTGGDLQGSRRYSHPRADDWPTAHIRQCQSGYNPASWRRHPTKVTPQLCLLGFTWKWALSSKAAEKRWLSSTCRIFVVLEFRMPCCG